MMNITAPVPKCLTFGDFYQKCTYANYNKRQLQKKKKRCFIFIHWCTPINTIVKFIIKKANLEIKVIISESLISSRLKYKISVVISE